MTRDAPCRGPWVAPPRLHDGPGPSWRALQEGRPLSRGAGVSLAAWKRSVLGLAEQAQTCNTARPGAPPPIVLVDGLWLTLAVPNGASAEDGRGRKRPGKRRQHRVRRTALGIGPDGHGEGLSWHLASHEDAPAWGAVVGTLYAQGVTEHTTALIVRDGSQGLAKALAMHLYGVPQQRGSLPKITHIVAHVPSGALAATSSRKATRAYKRPILGAASRIYSTDVGSELRARAQEFRATWETREPQAGAAFFHDFERPLAYLTVAFPRAYVSLMRTTNLLARFPKGSRRKQRDSGMRRSAAGGDVLWYRVALRETAKQRALGRGKG